MLPSLPPSHFPSLPAPFLHDARSVLLILLLGDPELMETAQTSQDTASNPSSILALDDKARRDQLVPRAGVDVVDLVIEAVVELVQQGGAAGDDDVGEQEGALIGVDVLDGGLDEARDRVFVLGLGVVCVVDGGAGVEEGLGGAEAVHAEDLVPAVGHLEGAARHLLCDVFVGAVGEASVAVPDLDDGFFELGEDALFFVAAEGVGGRGGEGLVRCLRCGAGVYGRLRFDHEVRCEGYLGLGLLETEADLVRDKVACEGRFLDSLS